MIAARVRLLAASLWVGGLWTVGGLVAPTLFATLPDPTLAGSIAGRLFRSEAWLSLLFGAVLLALLKFAADDMPPPDRKRAVWLVCGMLLCTLVGFFGLQPFMNALREAAGSGGVMSSDLRMQFGILHGASSLFYFMQGVLGIFLVLRVR